MTGVGSNQNFLISPSQSKCHNNFICMNESDSTGHSLSEVEYKLKVLNELVESECTYFISMSSFFHCVLTRIPNMPNYHKYFSDKEKEDILALMDRFEPILNLSMELKFE